MDIDHYKTLGVSRKASESEIRTAYRKLAKKHHPDRNRSDKTAEQKFKAVQEAYNILGDKDKRAQYDAYGSAGVGRFVNQGDQRQYRWGGGSTINVEDLGDLFTAFDGDGRRGRTASIFDQILGGGRRQAAAAEHRSAPGANVDRRVRLSFEQALRGASVEVDVSAKGRGKSRRQTLDVKIPPNIKNGQRIRLRGRGGAGRNGGPPGDLYLICDVQPHPYFRSEGADIYVDVPISLTEAALGAKVEVPTLHGSVTVTIPPGTSSGAKLRLRGKGLGPNGDSPPGDHYVVIQIVAPKNLDKFQKEALEQLATKLKDDPRGQVAWVQSDGSA